MIRDGLSRLLEARSLFAHVEVLVTNLVSDLEGDRRLLGDPQVQASDLICADDEGSSSESEDLLSRRKVYSILYSSTLILPSNRRGGGC